jgi:hypothetical protein
MVKKSPFSRTSTRDIELIRKWLHKCEDTHDLCRLLWTNYFPTRVINVGDGNREPFLVTDKHKDDRYLALSHRWGRLDISQKSIRTTKANLQQFHSAIPINDLPLTFRQAIDVTRAIGFQYLWIDSLCVIQDDIEDWEKESSAMGDVYMNSAATIFAERAANSDDGLFPTGQDIELQHSLVKEMEFFDPITKQQQHVLLSSALAFYPSTVAAGFCMVENSESHLQDRGWIMQEEILSRRKICFSRTELHWMCNHVSHCDCGIVSSSKAGSFDDPTAKLLYTSQKKDDVGKGLSGRHSTRTRAITDKGKAWERLITIFTERKLTAERDRLIALAGIASKQNRRATDYLAGIWRQEAEKQLLWRARVGSIPCHRYQDGVYYAPTWSWASLIGSVEFLHDASKLASSLWKIVDAECFPLGGKFMGPLSSGWIKIKGHVANVRVKEIYSDITKVEDAEKAWMDGDYEHQTRQEKAYYLGCYANPTDSIQIPEAFEVGTKLRLDTPEDWGLIKNLSNESFLFLFSGTIAHMMGSDLGAATGLLIRKSKRIAGAWERVCLMVSHHNWKEWKKLAYDAEVTLV